MTGRPRRAARQPPADLGAALEVAFRFLGTRPRTRQEIERRLARAGTDAELIEACISRLAELGYVDDLAFVRYWTEQRDTHAPRSQALVEMELRRLGIDAETLRAHREGADDAAPAPTQEATAAGEHARAVDALRRRLRGSHLDISDRQAVKRALDFLARRGFGYDAARAAVRTITDPTSMDEGAGESGP